jgi:hypothetical protein
MSESEKLAIGPDTPFLADATFSAGSAQFVINGSPATMQITVVDLVTQRAGQPQLETVRVAMFPEQLQEIAARFQAAAAGARAMESASTSRPH